MRATLIALTLALAACGGADFDEPKQDDAKGQQAPEQSPEQPPAPVRVQKPFPEA